MQMPEKVTIPCQKCGAELELTPPFNIRVDNWVVSQLTLVPAAGLQERRCRFCGWATAPQIAAEFVYGWAAVGEPETDQKIILAPDTRDVIRMAAGKLKH